MKNNKGITIISLIVTIVVIIILASITLYYGLTQNADKAVETKSTYEVFSFVDSVVNRELLHKLNPSYYDYVGDNDFETLEVDGKTYFAVDGWYLINKKEDFDELGLDNVQGEYIVNYKSGQAINLRGIKYQDVIYYSLNDLKKQMGGGSTVLSHVEFDEDKKVNKPVLGSGMIPVKLTGGKWVVTDVDDSSWYDYSLDQMAWANVMLKDELEVTGYTNEQVRKASISELAGKEVTTEGSAYVWIPRYTATSVGETGSKIIFSNLTNDVETLNGESYSLPESFRYNDEGEIIDLPGIWVSKYEASFDR